MCVANVTLGMNIVVSNLDDAQMEARYIVGQNSKRSALILATGIHSGEA